MPVPAEPSCDGFGLHNNKDSRLNRRSILLGAAGTFLLSACATSDPSGSDRPSYVESVPSIFVTADGKKIIFVGKRFTYIFDAPPALVDAFKSPFHAQLRARAEFFASGESIRGDMDLELSDDATDAQKKAAEAAGYQRSLPPSYYDRVRKENIQPRPTPKPSDSIFNRRVNLEGRRFAATDMTGVVTQKLNQTYQFKVTENGASSAGDSPLRKGADGVLFLGMMPLVLVVLLVAGPFVPAGSMR